MKTKNLTQVCNITTGKLDANAEVESGQYPFFTCAPDPLRIDTFAFDDDVILLAGNNAQGNFHIQRFRGKFNAYQRTYIITAKPGYDIDYIKYSLEISLQHLKKVAQGSQTKFLTMQILDSFQVADIPYDQQRDAIASLREIDRKIEKNKNICTELESMAKTLYDYWFTQFDFPDENGKPYRTSGGVMEWNEQLKREIPKGWSVCELSQICDTLLGGTPDTSIQQYWGGDIPWLSSGEIAQSPILSAEKSITSEGMNCSTTSFAKKGSVLLSITRYIRPTILGIDACFNQSVVAILPTDTYRAEFIYPFIQSQINRYMTLRTGAQQPHINKEVVDKTLIVCPTDDVLTQYYVAVEDVYALRMNIAKENRELTKLRDWLLPMLMNGQVTVADTAPKAKIIDFKNQQPKQYEVRQAARSFGNETTDDTSDLVKEFIKRRKNDSKS